MQKPTWVKVIGVLGIVFGYTGLLGSVHLFILPQVYRFWGRLFQAFQRETHFNPDFPVQAMDQVGAMLQVPYWFGTWAVIFGIVGLAVSTYYLISAIMLLQARPDSDKLFISALAAGMAVAVAQAVTIAGTGGFVAIFMSMGAAFSFFIDLVLLVVIVTSDRTIFRQETGSVTPPPTESA